MFLLIFGGRERERGKTIIMATLPAEKLSHLRQVIHAHVSQGGILEQIKACLTDALAQEGGR